jgi:hypothetical protein
MALVFTFLHGAIASTSPAADITTKPIEWVQEGDWVWAIDPITGERGPREVVGLIRGNGVKDLVTFTVNGDTLTATSGHPFWVNGRGWVDAGDVRVGDSFLQSDGGVSVVEAVESYSLWTTAYNFEVADLHTYLVEVDGEGVVVHNSGACGKALNAEKQGRHVRGSRNFDPMRSELTADPGQLASRLGSGQQVGPHSIGSAGSKERIDFGFKIGYHVDPSTGTRTATSKGIVHYATDDWHIVPARP